LLWWGDGVRLAVIVALLTLVSAGLSAFVTYQDHPKGVAATLTLIVLVVATVAAVINVFQQFA